MPKKFLAVVIFIITLLTSVFSGCSSDSGSALDFYCFSTVIHVETHDKPMSKELKTELEERIITVKDMAERNDYIKSLTDLKATWYVFGIQKPLKSFPSKFFVINDDIYIIGVVYDRNGESNCVVFRYNYVDDTYTFLYHSFHSANSITDVIPIEY